MLGQELTISTVWLAVQPAGGNMTGREWTKGSRCFTMKKVRLSRWSLVLGASLGVLGTLAVQQLVPEASAGKGQGPLERQAFHDTLDVVLDRYVEPVDTPTVMSRGLKHMVAGLDPYSHYMTAKERDLAQTRARQGAEAGLVTTLRGARDSGRGRARGHRRAPGQSSRQARSRPRHEDPRAARSPCWPAAEQRRGPAAAQRRVGLSGST